MRDAHIPSVARFIDVSIVYRHRACLDGQIAVGERQCVCVSTERHSYGGASPYLGAIPDFGSRSRATRARKRTSA